MEHLRVILDLEQKGMREGPYGVIKSEGEIVIGGMPNGTVGGQPIVMIGIDDPDGSGNVVVVETTLALFLTAADALKAKYGDPRRTF